MYGSECSWKVIWSCSLALIVLLVVCQVVFVFVLAFYWKVLQCCIIGCSSCLLAAVYNCHTWVKTRLTSAQDHAAYVTTASMTSSCQQAGHRGHVKSTWGKCWISQPGTPEWSSSQWGWYSGTVVMYIDVRRCPAPGCYTSSQAALQLHATATGTIYMLHGYTPHARATLLDAARKERLHVPARQLLLPRPGQLAKRHCQSSCVSEELQLDKFTCMLFFYCEVFSVLNL